MLHIFFRHTDTIIRKNKLIPALRIDLRIQFVDRQADLTALRRIFDRVGKQIGKHLPQPVTISYHMLVTHIKDIYFKGLLLILHQRPAHTDDIVHYIRQAHFFQHQVYFAALDLRHIQHFIDQPQQMPAGNIDLVQTAAHLLRLK